MGDYKKVIQRTFIPGSEWVYFKIYAGSNTIDKLLMKEIPKIISILERDKCIEKWFFIRFADPEFHLRIRLLTHDIGNVQYLFYKHFEKQIADEVIWKMQLDTYYREMERYKVHLMELGENLFHIDSISILKILKSLYDNALGEEERLILGVKMIDSFLDSFGYELPHKQIILSNMDNSFKLEFGYNEFNAKQLNALFREYSSRIDEFMNVNNVRNSYLFEMNKLLIKRSYAIKKVANRIKVADKYNDIDNLIFSYVHMMMNRLFRSKSRLYELLAYNFLNRYYLSAIARRNYNR